MNNKRKSRNILIVSGIASLVLSPFASHFLTPVLVTIHCNANPTYLCGIGVGTVYAGGILLGFLLLGAILIAIATGIKVKEKS